MEDQVDWQRDAEVQSLKHAGACLSELAERLERKRGMELQSLSHVRSGLNELAEGVERQRDAEAAALRALAELEPELDELRRLGTSEERREFDFFRLLGAHHAEEAHSNVLRWLLDPTGTHGANSSFLRQFMIRTARIAEQRSMSGITPSRVQEADWSDVEVRREWNYIDILVLNQREKVVCAIENKIWAPEGISDDGVSQLTRYRELIEGEFPNHERHFVFLTPSGMSSRLPQEQQFWIPESYAAVHQAVKDLLEENDDLERSDAFFAVAQYETTLRRNIVTSESEVAKLARRIYLEHRTAIELALRHKPDYKADLVQMLKHAIAEMGGWVLDHSSDANVRFRPTGWDRFEIQRSGTGWPPSTTLIQFEVKCREDPPHAELLLCLGPGSSTSIRERLFSSAQQNPSVFRPRSASLKGHYEHLLEPEPLLEEDDLGMAWDDGRASERIRGRLSRFFEDRFPAIDEIVTQCFEREPHPESAHGSISPPTDRDTSV